ncbi:DUF2971 domain-containing protein [Vibrio cholerae]|nr:DUF2971 domain-containing protein [Vibrio cholerae]
MHYKYLPASRLDVLQNLKIRFTPIGLLNDPYEVFGAKGLSTINCGFTGVYDGCLVLSLSKDPNNLLMWSHYADGGAGFVLGLDLNSANCSHIKTLSEEFTIDDVQYEDELPNLNDIDPKQLFLTKPKCWKYEEEARILAISNPEYLVPSHDYSIPMFLYSLPKDAIKKVYVGPNASELTKFYIKYFIEKHQIQCDIIQMVLNPERFGFLEQSKLGLSKNN